MYRPKYTIKEDLNATLDLINAYPFATLMSLDENKQPYFTHLPLLVKTTEPKLIIYGHTAKQNPQWTHFEKDSQAKIIFHGPNCYVTPTWYTSGRDVPTWAYAVAHLTGHVKLVHDFDNLVSILKTTSDKFEKGRPNPWQFELPADLNTAQTLNRGIVGYEISIENIAAKFKLNQSRPFADRVGVMNGLLEQGGDASLAVRELMLKESK